MLKVTFDAALVNSVLLRLPDHRFQYRSGQLHGQVKSPVGSFEVLAIPRLQGDFLVFTLPFKDIKGGNVGGFFLSKLLATFWNTLARQVETSLLPKLLQLGLSRDTLTLSKGQSEGGNVGLIKVSIPALNLWLSGQHPSLTGQIVGLEFHPEQVQVLGQIQAK